MNSIKTYVEKNAPKFNYGFSDWVEKMKEYYSNPQYIRDSLTNLQFFKYEHSDLNLMDFINKHNIQIKTLETYYKSSDEEDIVMTTDTEYDVYNERYKEYIQELYGSDDESEEESDSYINYSDGDGDLSDSE